MTPDPSLIPFFLFALALLIALPLWIAAAVVERKDE